MWDGAAQWESKSQRNVLIFDFSENSQSDTVSFFSFFLFVIFFFFFFLHLINVSQKKLYSPSSGLHSRSSRECKLKETKALFVLFAEAICSFGCLCISLQLTLSQERETLNASWNESKWVRAVVFPPLFNPPFLFNQIQRQFWHKTGTKEDTIDEYTALQTDRQTDCCCQIDQFFYMMAYRWPGLVISHRKGVFMGESLCTSN